jgi:hypothetical protein
MYSYCKDPEGNPIHFAAWTKVRKVWVRRILK